MDWENRRVVVTGGAGFLGRVLCEKLARHNLASLSVPRRSEFDLTTEAGCVAMYRAYQPDVVLHLAAEVGGIGANREHPGRFFYANMAMGLHLIEQARGLYGHLRPGGLEKFVQVGTVCAYPKFAPVPFREESLWDGFPEETNAPYGIAKKALFVMLEAYANEYGLPSTVVVPVNLYGPGDNFDLHTSHVVPALIRKCLEAKAARAPRMTCWGTGAASREFLYVDDAAEGILAAAEHVDDPSPINLGTGNEIRIKDLAELIARETGFTGRVEWDPSKPDGQPRRCLDTQKAARRLGWQAKTGFEDGIRQTIDWYLGSLNSERAAA